MCVALFCRPQHQPPTSDEVGMRKTLTSTLQVFSNLSASPRLTAAVR